MTEKEFTELANKHLVVLESYQLDKDGNKQFNIFGYKQLYEAITVTPCCTELKDKEVLSFEEWLFVNNYKKLFDYFVKDAVSFTESELMQIYNDKVMNL